MEMPRPVTGLLWANYRGEPFRDAEQLMFGVSAFGFMLSVVLALLA